MVVVFSLKTNSIFKNETTYESSRDEGELVYGDLKVEDLVSKDTDGDGIWDWEEGLYGLDPAKKETVSGTPDTLAIKDRQTKAEQKEPGVGKGNEPLTKTDKFSRELFATVATLNQTGTIDQAAAEEIGISLAEQIQNSGPRKIFALSDIKISASDNMKSSQKYSDALHSIYAKRKIQKGVAEVWEDFIEGGEDPSALSQLDPIITETDKIIGELLKTEVPKSLSLLHLDLINSHERVLENISDMKLFEKDSLLAMVAIGQYEENTTALELAADRLIEAIGQKLNN